MLPWHIRDLATAGSLSMTDLAINLSQKTNSVAEKHRDVCRDMFPEVDFDNVTNGVHHLRWASVHTRALLDKYISGWEASPALLEKAKTDIPTTALKSMRRKNKQQLVDWVNKHPHFFSLDSQVLPDDLFDADTLTIGFARRIVPYKRTGLIFRDLDRLRDLGYKKLQLVFAGPTHADNHFANNMIHKLRDYAEQLRGQVRVAVIPEYNTDISSYLISGSDVWLNNPVMPREASGTSGMKSALNGGLNLSIADGWWIEGHDLEPGSGWSFGTDEHYNSDSHRDELDAASLYDRLEEVIECYYNDQKSWAKRSKDAISLMRFFSSDRAIEQYDKNIWS